MELENLPNIGDIFVDGTSPAWTVHFGGDVDSDGVLAYYPSDVGDLVGMLSVVDDMQVLSSAKHSC